MKRILFAAIAAWIAMPAAAQNCAPRDVVIKNLAEKYGETRQVIGLDGRGNVMEVFGNVDSGSWTLTVTSPNGQVCMVAAGQQFEILAEGPAKGGDPA